MIRLSWIIKHWRPQELADTSKTYYYKDGSFSRYKHWEVQVSKWADRDNLLELTLDLIWTGSDHAGPELCIALLGYWFNVKMYDSRNWDWETGAWEEYPGAIDKRNNDSWDE